MYYFQISASYLLSQITKIFFKKMYFSKSLKNLSRIYITQSDRLLVFAILYKML